MAPSGRSASGRAARAGAKAALERPDGAGLWPIHWAAINNRPDLIEALYEAGSALAKPCGNRLLAHGTPLHLAAMNGSLEAAAALLAKSRELEGRRTRPKSVASIESSPPNETSKDNRANNNSNNNNNDQASDTQRMLEARDAEGQTPLMRAAAPRTKRMDAIRDLLRKNLWSLSGRPAEMALFLICSGADWRSTEPASGMNLLHLAIVNDHSDIVSLMLVLDASLVDTPAGRAPPEPAGGAAAPSPEPQTSTDDDSESSPSSSAATDDSGASGAPQRRPLLSGSSRRTGANDNARARELLAAGLKPLQLAILYGRVSCISQLWHASRPGGTASGGGVLANAGAQLAGAPSRARSQMELQQEALRGHRQSVNQRELKRVLIRACYANKHELARFLKPALLRGALLLDLVLLALVWAPAYVSMSGLAGGLFLLTYVFAMALALRVTLKNPGFLRRNSVQYLSELSKLLEGRASGRAAPSDPRVAQLRAQSQPEAQAQAQPQPQPQPQQQPQEDLMSLQRRSAEPLIKLEPVGASSSRETQPKASQAMAERPVVSVVASAPPPVDAFKQLQDKVRLFCHKCQCVRRPRSRHCNSCNHCVQDFDHHCIYLGACIGRHNRLDFLLAMVALAIMGLYGTALHSFAWDDANRHERRALSRAHWPWPGLGLLWVLKYALIGGLSAFQTLRRACLGVTLYEEVRSKRIRRTLRRASLKNNELASAAPDLPTGAAAAAAKSRKTILANSLKGSLWRYAPDRFLTGDLPAHKILANLREFTNYLTPGEYLLTFVCTDTPLARSLTSSDWRIKQLYKFV